MATRPANFTAETRLDKGPLRYWPVLCEDLFHIPLWPDAHGRAAHVPVTPAEIATRSGLSLADVLARVTSLMDHLNDLEITAPALKEALDQDPAQVLVIDVRDPWETTLCAIAGSRFAHNSDLEALWGELTRVSLVVTVCHHGARSYGAAVYLRQKGITQARSLEGGVEAWALTVDPAMARY